MENLTLGQKIQFYKLLAVTAKIAAVTAEIEGRKANGKKSKKLKRARKAHRKESDNIVTFLVNETLCIQTKYCKFDVVEFDDPILQNLYSKAF